MFLRNLLIYVFIYFENNFFVTIIVLFLQFLMPDQIILGLLQRAVFKSFTNSFHRFISDYSYCTATILFEIFGLCIRLDRLSAFNITLF